ncbi:MAG: hypothetical protein MUF65_11705 [Rubritepida sp.]|nr:hypothetical protein [Rubritepida sp.]MCU0946019.1 hypothetical protein [Rubritepida sp.]
MAWLALGAAALLATLILLYAFANASPGAVKKSLVWGLASVGAVAIAVMLATGRGLSTIVWTSVVFGPAIMQGWRAWRARRAFSRPAPEGGEASGVETATLEMRLDLASGAMTGRVRRGPYAGRDLSEMDVDELRWLLAECASEDPESVPLLEAWLDRTAPGWREEPPPAAAGPMTRAEALAVLGLAEGASEAEIRAAHRRLMQSAHPDRGGSDWLAARINEARAVLLG